MYFLITDEITCEDEHIIPGTIVPLERMKELVADYDSVGSIAFFHMKDAIYYRDNCMKA